MSAEGFNGLNYWRKDGSTHEVSDDGIHWVPAPNEEGVSDAGQVIRGTFVDRQIRKGRIPILWKLVGALVSIAGAGIAVMHFMWHWL